MRTLNAINDDAGGGVLETGERELLVPMMNDAVRLMGIDVSQFEDGDPTGAWREF